MLKSLIILGTRPEAVKLAPVIMALKEAGFHVKVIATGQHNELAREVLDFFAISADYYYCMNPDLHENTACMAKVLKDILRKEKPDCVIVQGDTLSCYMGAYAAFLEKIPVMHVEAGLRSFDRYSPFPEEIYRRLTDTISDIFFAPTKKAVENLLKEGHRKDRILLTGNTVVDAAYKALQILDRETIREELEEITGKNLNAYDGIVFITAHRRENIGKPMKDLIEAVDELSKKYSHLLFMWSLHKNPEVRQIILKKMVNSNSNLCLVEPLSYPQTVYILENSTIIITDSGGLQEEACVFKKPVLITRNLSERPEVVEVGLGKIVGTNKEIVIKVFDDTYKNIREYESITFKNPYGDGRASERIAEFLMCANVRSFLLDYRNRYMEDLYECSKI